MEFRTFDDLGRCVLANISHIPQDIDVVVGIPRSEMHLASIINYLIILFTYGGIENRD